MNNDWKDEGEATSVWLVDDFVTLQTHRMSDMRWKPLVGTVDTGFLSDDSRHDTKEKAQEAAMGLALRMARAIRKKLGEPPPEDDFAFLDQLIDEMSVEGQDSEGYATVETEQGRRKP